jgi:hypothetical protein
MLELPLETLDHQRNAALFIIMIDIIFDICHDNKHCSSCMENVAVAVYSEDGYFAHRLIK